MLPYGLICLYANPFSFHNDAARVKRYDAIVRASVDWFFSSVQRVTVKGRVCYKWSYLSEEPLHYIEDAKHGGYDIAGLYRAYRSGRYGITAAMMAPFANTALYVMQTPEGRFIPRVDGIQKPKDPPPGGLGNGWIDLCEFEPKLLPILVEANRRRIKSSPAITANLLWQRHQLNKQLKEKLP
jgi:hypothetical protein